MRQLNPIDAQFVDAEVSILSYCGNLTFGITGDYATTPDIEVLAHGIETSAAELLATAQRSAAGRERRSP